MDSSSSLSPWSLALAAGDDSSDYSCLGDTGTLSRLVTSELESLQIALQTPLDDIQSFVARLQSQDVRVCSGSEFTFTSKDLLGSGRTYAVYKAAWRARDNKMVALKKLIFQDVGLDEENDDQLNDYGNALETCAYDLRVMAHPWMQNHPNIVNLLAVSWEMSRSSVTSFHPFLVVELADEEYPTLDALLSKNGEKLSLENRIKLVVDIAEALSIVNGCRIIYGDLKPSNILVFRNDNQYTAKLADFGFSKPFVDSKRPIGGTYYWGAPECGRRADREIQPYANTVTIDSYSLGLVAWYILFSEAPFGPETTLHDDDGFSFAKNRYDSQIQPSLAKNIEKMVKISRENGNSASLADRKALWSRIHATLRSLLQYDPRNRDVDVGMVRGLLDIHNESKTREPSFLGSSDRRGHIVRSLGSASLGPHLKLPPIDIDTLPQAVKEAMYERFLQTCESQASDVPTSAMSNLGFCYSYGFGTEKDNEKASTWFFKAARMGCDVAKVTALTRVRAYGYASSLKPEINEEYEWLCVALRLFSTIGGGSPGNLEKRLRALFPISTVSLLVLRKSFDEILGCQWEPWSVDAIDSPIFDATAEGNVEVVREMFDKDVTPGLRFHGYSLLHIAALAGKAEVVQALAGEFQMDPDEKSDNGDTAIDLAIRVGSLRTLLSIISLGADLAPLRNQQIFQHCALSPWERFQASAALRIVYDAIKLEGGDEEAKKLINYGKNSNSDDDEPIDPEANISTPLQTSVSFGNWDAFRALLELGADPNVPVENYPPLFLAIARPEPVISAILLEMGAFVDERAKADEDYCTPLLFCCSGKEIEFCPPPGVIIWDHTKPDDCEASNTTEEEKIKELRRQKCTYLLISYGADVNAQDFSGNTPLIYAIESQHIDIVTRLLENGADIDKANFAGYKPIHKAARKGTSFLQLCLQYNAKIRDKTLSGVTPLGEAITAGMVDCCEFLLEQDPKLITDTCWDGTTCFHWAVANEQACILEILLSRLFSLDLPREDHIKFLSKADNRGVTALHVATQSKYGASFLSRLCPLLPPNAINYEDHLRRTAIHYAVEEGNVDATKTLLEHGAAANCIDKWGNAPLQLCRSIEVPGELMEVLMSQENVSAASNPPRQNLIDPNERSSQMPDSEGAHDAEDAGAAFDNAERQQRLAAIVEEIKRKRAEMFPERLKLAGRGV